MESQAIYVALIAGSLGALAGLILALTVPPLPMAGDWSFGAVLAVMAAATAAVAGTIGYWGGRTAHGQEWRQNLSSVTFTINTIAVVLVHVVLAALTVLVVYIVLGLGFVGLLVDLFWSVVLAAVTLGLTGYITYLSVSRMTTQRMSTLLMAFVAIGTIAAMITTTDKSWWGTHFSHLGTFWSVSSLLFNGTLVVGGLLVTAFAVYLANDLRALVKRGILQRASSSRVISIMFIVMGVMLAGVGLVPVNVSRPIHNICASGMAVMFIGLLVAGPWVVRGMPRAYFIASGAFLAAVLLSTALFVVGYFGLTAFEIIVFALVFGWIAVFIRFLGVADQATEATSGLGA
ncbi:MULTISPECIES: hypothetical protein [unclassified Microbacterium]|uniref:hypothetical protein n=1 Tax=unclassified Microbacterium TaxID=2609290 RepID=UPI00301B3B55